MDNQNSFFSDHAAHPPDNEAAQKIFVPIRAPDPEITLDELAVFILSHKEAVGKHSLEIGKALVKTKELHTTHGEWLKWLSNNVKMSGRMAQYYMRLAKNYSNPKTVADLGMSKALALIAVPEEKREEFINETHEVDGVEKLTVEMTVRELRLVIQKEVKRDSFDETSVEDQELLNEAKLAQIQIDKLFSSLEQYFGTSAVKEEISDRVYRISQKINECVNLTTPEILVEEAG